jgi:hypothetical protein
MRSAAQSKATALNEAEIAEHTTNVRYSAACIARFHANRRTRLSIKRELRHGTLECACSRATVYDSVMDMSDEDVRWALAQGHVNLISVRARHDTNQKLLAFAQSKQERWRHETPSTDALYGYVAQLADSWLHSLAQPSAPRRLHL